MSAKAIASFLTGMLLSALLFGQLPRPQCTDPGWYRRSCDGNWNFAIPGNLTGHTFQGCGAHTLYVYDEDGAQYAIINQCYAFSGCTGTMGTYKKPDHPGKALTLWNNYYVGPDAAQQRALYPYVNPSFSVPTGVQHYDFLTLAQVPEPFRSHYGQVYGCPGITPAPTVPVPPTRTVPPTPARTATRQPTTASGCCREGIDCIPGAPVPRCTPTPCTGGPSCTTRTAINSSTAVPSASRTPLATITPPITGACGVNSLLLTQRFCVTATWTKPSGESGHGIPVKLRAVTTSVFGDLISPINDTGAFYFFSPDNLELMVKALDGCQINSRYWVFAAGLSNVAITITVTDTRTGAVKTYTNQQGQAFLPIQDTGAFPCQ